MRYIVTAALIAGALLICGVIAAVLIAGEEDKKEEKHDYEEHR